ncbi:MAG TPA: response regulator [Candidatus Angelobacter sp.]|nr:response regulator [Candidatus Angelobacter sp.]
MSTRILFADDSVTAQNMGKRILTEAGYEVVAVSNGAAAVKKIAEQKPDIIILDLYMPGYSGLEVCEKVRGSMATLKTPVLLTVGKMEPYRPEDANRVRADGVIVKPFEASDLLAIIKKFEERIVAAPPPLAQQVEAASNEGSSGIAELPVEAAQQVSSHPAQPMVDVPDHMASSAAFVDLLGMEGQEPTAGAPPPPMAQQSAAAAAQAGVPEYELPPSWRREEETAKAEIELPLPATSVPEPPQHDVQVFETAPVPPAAIQHETDVAPPPASSHPLQIPVYQESAGAAPESVEILPTSAPPIGEIEIPRDPYLQETAAEATRSTVADITDPGLMSDTYAEPIVPPQHHQEEAKTAPVDSEFAIEQTQETPLDIPVHESQPPEPAPAPVQEKSFADSDFEARVAAALASYNHDSAAPRATEPPPAIHEIEHSEPHFARTAEPAPHMAGSGIAAEAITQPQPIEPERTASAEVEHAVSAFEYRPPIGTPFAESNAAESSSFAAAAPAHAPEPAPAFAAEPVAILPEPPAEDVIEAAAESKPFAASSAQASRENIAQAVARVMERLKPELVDEILRELKPRE